ncbi:MAG: helix-turn-helix domain-containing protein [Prevotella sp.]|nr:helix-turn-helix domain-containing protein [Prevotella sp.]
MKDRIKLIMDNEHLTPSAFADQLQLGRAVISHILNGRNNPSLDVVSRILSKLNYINSDWLLTGNGNMYKDGYGENNQTITSPSPIYPVSQSQPDLFSQNNISTPPNTNEIEYRKENVVKQQESISENTINQTIVYQKAPDRKIAKIIIYYTDNTFETFNADNKPL